MPKNNKKKQSSKSKVAKKTEGTSKEIKKKS